MKPTSSDRRIIPPQRSHRFQHPQHRTLCHPHLHHRILQRLATLQEKIGFPTRGTFPRPSLPFHLLTAMYAWSMHRINLHKLAVSVGLIALSRQSEAWSCVKPCARGGRTAMPLTSRQRRVRATRKGHLQRAAQIRRASGQCRVERRRAPRHRG